MKKLNKRTHAVQNTVAAYAGCYCTCGVCSCICTDPAQFAANISKGGKTESNAVNFTPVVDKMGVDPVTF